MLFFLILLIIVFVISYNLYQIYLLIEDKKISFKEAFNIHNKEAILIFKNILTKIKKA